MVAVRFGEELIYAGLGDEPSGMDNSMPITVTGAATRQIHQGIDSMTCFDMAALDRVPGLRLSKTTIGSR